MSQVLVANQHQLMAFDILGWVSYKKVILILLYKHNDIKFYPMPRIAEIIDPYEESNQQGDRNVRYICKVSFPKTREITYYDNTYSLEYATKLSERINSMKMEANRIGQIFI